jgi:hypothetical protein
MSIASMTRVTPITIRRPTVSANAAQTITYTTVFRGWCRLQPLSAAEQARQSRDLGSIVAKAYMDGVVDVRSDDLLTVAKSGDKYQVKGARDIDLLGRLTTVELGRETGAA